MPDLRPAEDACVADVHPKRLRGFVSRFGDVTVLEFPDGLRCVEKRSVIARLLEKSSRGHLAEDVVGEAAVLIVLEQARADARSELDAAEGAKDGPRARLLREVVRGFTHVQRLAAAPAPAGGRAAEALAELGVAPRGALFSDGELFSVRTEYAGGDLCDHLEQGSVLTSEILECLHSQCAAGLTALHWAGFAHADLNVENVCVRRTVDVAGSGAVAVKATLIDLAQAFVHPKSPYFIRWVTLCDLLYGVIFGGRKKSDAPLHRYRASAVGSSLFVDEDATRFTLLSDRPGPYLVGKLYSVPLELCREAPLPPIDLYALDAYALSVVLFVAATRRKPMVNVVYSGEASKHSLQRLSDEASECIKTGSYGDRAPHLSDRLRTIMSLQARWRACMPLADRPFSFILTAAGDPVRATKGFTEQSGAN
jgi:hypothetical protein